MAAVAAPAVVVAAAAVDEWCLHLGEKMDANNSAVNSSKWFKGIE